MSFIQKLLNRPCNILFTFEDRRDENGYGHVIGPGGRIFNHQSKDTNANLRKKFAQLFLINVFTGTFFRLPTKCYDFVTGGSILRGIDEGKCSFRLYRLQKYKAGQNNVHCLGKPYFVGTRVLVNIVKDIVKIATFPLALIGTQAAALVGIFCPLEGWVFTSIIEDLWVHDSRLDKQQKIIIFTKCLVQLFTCNKTQRPLVRSRTFAYFGSPCMQPQRVWKKQNLYRFHLYEDYNPNTLRSLKLRLDNLIDDSTPYLKDETVKTLKEGISKLSKEIAELCPSKNEEEETTGEGILLINRGKERYIKFFKEVVKEETAKAYIGLRFDNISRLSKKLHDSIDLINNIVDVTDSVLELGGRPVISIQEEALKALWTPPPSFFWDDKVCFRFGTQY